MSAPTRMTVDELRAFLDRDFAQIHSGGRTFEVLEVGPMTARLRMDYHEKHLRPGGTISGPSMFALCDLALYCAILAQIGPVALAVGEVALFSEGADDLLAHAVGSYSIPPA